MVRVDLADRFSKCPVGVPNKYATIFRLGRMRVGWLNGLRAPTDDQPSAISQRLLTSKGIRKPPALLEMHF